MSVDFLSSRDGFSLEDADRNLLFRSVPCQASCPVLTDIPAYIDAIGKGEFVKAYTLNRLANFLPGILGRICTRPCEAHCRHGEEGLGNPVQICHLKRVAADLSGPEAQASIPIAKSTGYQVGIIGAGPSGLAAARTLALLGHAVVLYDAHFKPGGMLTHGLPAFRLPQQMAAFEIDAQIKDGIQFKAGICVGRDITLGELREQNDALLITVGCQEARELTISGYSLNGVVSGLTFVQEIYQYQQLLPGKRVMVVGDGFTAADCACLAMRAGAKEVAMLSPTDPDGMPLPRYKQEELSQEGIVVLCEAVAKSITSKEGGVGGLVYTQKSSLNVSQQPISRVQSEYVEIFHEADIIIIAIGQQVDTTFLPHAMRCSLDNSTQQGSYRTSVEGIYGAGDCVTGPTNVITAIGHGRCAAEEINQYFTGEKKGVEGIRIEAYEPSGRNRRDDFVPPTPMPMINWRNAGNPLETELESGFDAEQAQQEAKRCYRCNLIYEIDSNRCLLCMSCVDIAPRDCILLRPSEDVSGVKDDPTQVAEAVSSLKIDPEHCIRCDQCRQVCPVQCIHIRRIRI